MNKRKIPSGPDGWFALLVDEYEAQRVGGLPLLKTPVVAWSYDPWGEERPTAYGHIRGPWTELNKKLRDGANEPPMPLLYDLLLAPNGEIIDRQGESFENLEVWLGTYGTAKIIVKDGPGIPLGHPRYSRPD
jgi:hypothetical protein